MDTNFEDTDVQSERLTTVYLKGGKTEQVRLDEIDQYLAKNEANLKPRKIKTRGTRRSASTL